MPKSPADLSFRKFTALAVLERTGMSVVLHSPAVLVLILSVCVASVTGGLEKVCTTEVINEGPAQGGLCGSQVPEVINLVCKLYGYHSGFQRRSASYQRRSVGYKHLQKEPNPATVNDLTMTKSGALSYLTKRDVAFGRQGITCECCYNACSPVELVQYC